MANKKLRKIVSRSSSEQIIKFVNDNPHLNANQIARQLNKDHSTIHYHLKKHGIKRTQEINDNKDKTKKKILQLSQDNPHLPYKSIAHMAGSTYNNVSKTLANSRSIRSFSEFRSRRHRDVINHINANPNYNIKELASKFSYTPDYVGKIINKYKKSGDIKSIEPPTKKSIEPSTAEIVKTPKPIKISKPRPNNTERNSNIVSSYKEHGYSETVRRLGLKRNVVSGVLHRHFSKLKDKKDNKQFDKYDPATSTDLKDRVKAALEKVK